MNEQLEVESYLEKVDELGVDMEDYWELARKPRNSDR